LSAIVANNSKTANEFGNYNRNETKTHFLLTQRAAAVYTIAVVTP